MAAKKSTSRRKPVEAAAPAPAQPSLEEEIAKCFWSPLRFVQIAFPWRDASTFLAGEDGPDTWQVEVMQAIENRLRQGHDPKAAVDGAIRVAVRSGNGVGKTTLISWLILWFMSTRSHPQIVVTAGTKTQLDTKTWRELSKWHRIAINAAWFKWTQTKLYHVDAPSTWFAAAIPWSKERSDAFQGTHEKHVLIIYDEASTIEDSIWNATEGSLTTKGAIWIAFGNPYRNSGNFRECFRRFRHRWTGIKVDSRYAKMADKGQIREWLEDYDEDSDHIRVKVRGEFPRVASTQFIGEEMVEIAAKRIIQEVEYQYEPIVFGLDVAYFGDDQNALAIRQGRHLHALLKWREVEPQWLAWEIIRLWKEWDADALFLEDVGVGAGVASPLRTLGWQPQSVFPGAPAMQPRVYADKRMEMWMDMRTWLTKGGGCVAVKGEIDADLKTDLTTPEYGFDGKGRLRLESVHDIKKRNMPSPDTATALALTFAMPVMSRAMQESVVERKLREAYQGTRGRHTWMGA